MAAAPAAPPTPARRPRGSAAPDRGQPAGRSGGTPHHSRRPSLRVVDAPRRARRWSVVMLVTALLGVAGIASLSAASAEAAFTADELQREVTELERVRGELAADVAELSSLERIREVAERELDMVPADEPRYIEAESPQGVPAAHGGGQPVDPVKAARRGRH